MQKACGCSKEKKASRHMIELCGAADSKHSSVLFRSKLYPPQLLIFFFHCRAGTKQFGCVLLNTESLFYRINSENVLKNLKVKTFYCEYTLSKASFCPSRALQGRSRDKTWSTEPALCFLLPHPPFAKTSSSSPAVAVWLRLLQERKTRGKEPEWEGGVNLPQLLSRHTHAALLPFPEPHSINPSTHPSIPRARPLAC